MKYFIQFSCFLIPAFALAQVGIGTTEPKAQLDVIAANGANPATIDGVLIPRIEKFPSANPSSDQHGMLVFLNREEDDFNIGFYYWNDAEIQWKNVGVDSKTTNFYKEGTTENPGNIEDPMFRKGNVGIGTEEISSRLQIAIKKDQDLDLKKGLEIDNNNSATDNLTTYGIVNENRSATNGTKYGIKNKVAGDGSGIHYGLHNVTTQNSGTNDIYGIYNRVGRTYGANSDNFGIYSQIGTATGSGNIYGIYATAFGDRNANVFAGYFAGRVGIGFSPGEDYVLPPTRGKEGQVLVTDNSGEVKWENNNSKNYTSTGGASGNFVIPDEVYSLRITNSPSSITLPDASSNRGRILVLIGWQGSGATNLNFLNGDTLYDLETNSNITEIAAKKRMMIQSIGTRWIVLF